MNKKTYLIVLPLLLLAVGLLAGCIRGVTGDSLVPAGEHGANSDTHLPIDAHAIEDDHVTVDPRLLELFEESEWVHTDIRVRMPPGFEWAEGPHDDAYIEHVLTMDQDLYTKLRHEQEAGMRAALGSDLSPDFAIYTIRLAGVQTLRNLPFVISVQGYNAPILDPDIFPAAALGVLVD